MSDYEEEEENLHFYGKPLEALDEDEIPKKRPISIEDQVARDAQGRRRFHGAFTGGFSAGFFNTVGSLEGWTPKEFKSSRSEKSSNVKQKPEDFMDDEDLGEFGFAPQKIKATKEYSTSKKRKKHILSDGPIPGEPVLHSLLQSDETIGYLLLKNIGVKDKEAELRLSLKKDKEDKAENGTGKFSEEEFNNLYKEYLKTPKHNTFGLGYIGLEKTHLPIYSKSNLTVLNKSQSKKLTITGQAFGVGAFEEEDDDIYVKEDMSNYDFELTSEKSTKQIDKTPQKDMLYDNFIMSKELIVIEKYRPPPIPSSFTGKYRVKKSRFEPIVNEKEEVPKRKEINAETRNKILGDRSIVKDSTNSDSIISQTNMKPQEDLQKLRTPQDVKSITGNIKVIDFVTKGDDVSKESTKTNEGPTPTTSALIFDRFVSEGNEEEVPIDYGTNEMQDAAKMKMFGPLTRVTLTWQPVSLLCKRFNLPEPLYGEIYTKPDRKRRNNLIFEYEKHMEHTPNLTPGLCTSTDSNKKEEMEEDDDAPIPDQSDAAVSIMDSSEPHAIHPIDEATKSNADEQQNVIAEEVKSRLFTSKLQEKNETAKEHETIISKSDITENSSVTNEMSVVDGPPPLDITEKVDVSKNMDLFKAIFLSDDEDDDKELEQENAIIIEPSKSTDIIDDLIPRFKPSREGLLSNINFSHKFTPKKKIVEETQDAEEVLKEKEEDVNIYGPKLPTNTIASNQTQYNITGKEEKEHWVEKDAVKERHKEKKKHKKEKKKKHKKRH